MMAAQVQALAAPAAGAMEGVASPAAVAAAAAATATTTAFPATSLYVGDLDVSVQDAQLFDVFSQVGSVVSVRVCRDVNTRMSLGYAYVNFSSPADAARALEMLNFTPVNGKPIRIMYSNRDPSSRKSGAANIFIKNLSESTTEDNLKELFGNFGPITSVIVVRADDGKSRCFGFVNFENPDDAVHAVEDLNGKKFDDKELYVGRAQKKSEREMQLKESFEKSNKETADRNQGTNLYLKNLDGSVDDDEKLKELFAEFGTITSCKVMRDSNGVNKGSGFVAFKSSEDATRALVAMNGKMVGSKPLYVALAQRKEERRARLQAQFSQMRPVMPPPVAPRMPMYPPGVPGMGQQLFYGQPPPAFVNPQPGYGFQQHMIPGMRPGVAPMPNFVMPMVQQGQQPQRPSGRRAGAGGMQQPMPMGHQQMVPRGGRGGYRYASGRGMPEAAFRGVGGMAPSLYEMGRMTPGDTGAPQQVSSGALASALANSPPEQQRLMLGESLYPLVDQLEHDQAAKVTGMLLEMDQTEVLHLIESPDALKSKVAEAMEVLRSAQQQQTNVPADQLAALSLSDGFVAS
uniref:PABP n=1 Tax=Hordeum vulgare subsp. vulgare TaxID=112509 RepID=A0A8I6YP00_HORVV